MDLQAELKKENTYSPLKSRVFINDIKKTV